MWDRRNLRVCCGDFIGIGEEQEFEEEQERKESV